MDTKLGDFIVHLSIVALKFFKENLSTNLFSSLFSLKKLRRQKEPSIAFYCFTCFHVFFPESLKSTCVQPVVKCVKVICKTNE